MACSMSSTRIIGRQEVRARADAHEDSEALLNCHDEKLLDFLTQLLTYDAAERPSAKQALRHPFISSHLAERQQQQHAQNAHRSKARQRSVGDELVEKARKADGPVSSSDEADGASSPVGSWSGHNDPQRGDRHTTDYVAGYDSSFSSVSHTGSSVASSAENSPQGSPQTTPRTLNMQGNRGGGGAAGGIITRRVARMAARGALASPRSSATPSSRGTTRGAGATPMIGRSVSCASSSARARLAARRAREAPVGSLEGSRRQDRAGRAHHKAHRMAASQGGRPISRLRVVVVGSQRATDM